MIKTYDMLVQELSSYEAPANKIMRMAHSGELVPIARGVYETTRSAPPAALAACIYGPSYVSFEYALAHYGIIPERTAVVTSATFEKRRSKEFVNAFGTYSFRDVPSQAFPLSLRIEREGDYAYRIASPEKAVCDQIYKVPPVGSVKALLALLFDDLRMDESSIGRLDGPLLAALTTKYRKANNRLLGEAIKKGRI